MEEKGARQSPLEERLRGGDHQVGFSHGQSPEGGEPAVLPLAGDHSGVVKGEFPAGQGEDLLPGKGMEVLSKALGLPFVGAHHHHPPAGLGPKSGGKVGAVDCRQAGHGRRAGTRIQGGEQ